MIMNEQIQHKAFITTKECFIPISSVLEIRQHDNDTSVISYGATNGLADFTRNIDVDSKTNIEELPIKETTFIKGLVLGGNYLTYIPVLSVLAITQAKGYCEVDLKNGTVVNLVGSIAHLIKFTEGPL